MRPKATMTAFALDIEEDGLTHQIVVMVKRGDRQGALKALEGLTAEWSMEVVGFKALDGYLG